MGLYKQDRADDTNSIKSDDCCEKEQDLGEEEVDQKSTPKKADEPSEAGATTETPETEVENNAEVNWALNRRLQWLRRIHSSHKSQPKKI